METKLVTISCRHDFANNQELWQEVSRVSEEYKQELTAATRLLALGELVAFPTETVYGLGGNALNPASATKIYEAKGRPSDNPLIVHVATLAEAQAVAEVSPIAARILAEFCPAPLTLVLPKKSAIPYTVTGGLETVGVRIPRHPVALALLKACRLPLAAPSANLSGKPSPTMGSHVFDDLQGKISMVLDSGNADVGLESTVVDLTCNPPAILRPGRVLSEDLARFCGEVTLGAVTPSDTAPKAPGMKYRHYAPEGQVQLVTGEQMAKVYTELAESPLKIAVMATDLVLDSLSFRSGDYPFSLGKSSQDLSGVAQRVFAGLRYCDALKADLILVEAFPTEGLGIAVMNRLTKAAAKS